MRKERRGHPLQPRPPRLSPDSGDRISLDVTAHILAAVQSGRRADRTLSEVIRGNRGMPWEVQRLASQAAFAACRWWGWTRDWVEGLFGRLVAVSLLLDGETEHPFARRWAERRGWDLDELATAGDWRARAKLVSDWLGAGLLPADPSLLFPAWVPEVLVPVSTTWCAIGSGWPGASLRAPGTGPSADRGLEGSPPATRSPDTGSHIMPLETALVLPAAAEQVSDQSYDADRRPEHDRSAVSHLLHWFQIRPPLWIRTRLPNDQLFDPDSAERIGYRPHPTIPYAATVGDETDVYGLDQFRRGLFEIQDLSSQAIGLVCDARPGQRWWDACAGAGGKTLHLAALMQGRGTVLASDIRPDKLRQLSHRARRSGFSNICPKPWNGRKLPAKPASFDGVLVDAPCTCIGTWRRNPDARWTTRPEAIGELARTQAEILDAAARGVKPGGVLVYATCTLTHPETIGVIDEFRRAHPEFSLAPFRHPITGDPTDGLSWILPHHGDSDAMFVARMVRND